MPADKSDIVKNWIDIFKSVFLIVLFIGIIWNILFNRSHIKHAAIEMGITKVSGGGVEIALGETSDALPKIQAALDSSKAEFAKLETEYARAIDALKRSQAAGTVGAIGLPSAPSHVLGANKQLIANVLQKAPETLSGANRATAQIVRAERAATRAIRALPGGSDASVGFGVVFGADRDLAAAETQLAVANSVKGGQPHLFRRQGTLRSVLVFDSPAAAAAVLPQVRELNRYSRGAYVVNLASWCPQGNLNDRLVDCRF